jgi:hypothetical protein
MSEPHDAPENDAPEEGEEQQPDEQQGGEAESGDEGDGDEPPARAAKPEDWEKRAHNHAGQAARERSKRQAAERRAQELEGRLERLEKQGGGSAEDELLATIAGLREDDDDPMGDIARVKQALRIFRSRQVAETEETSRAGAVERQINGLKSAMADCEADFVIEHPDYMAAAKHYRDARVEELKDAGYAGHNLDRKLADDLFGVVRMSLEAGLDPAERVYALAQKRGFKVGQKQADQKLNALDRAGASGVRANGRTPAGVLSWGDVAKLDGAARDKAWAKLRERERRTH